MDVAAWLRSLDLQQYEAAFREHAVDASTLPRLTAEDLKELGVTRVGHRRKLLDAIATLLAHSRSALELGDAAEPTPRRETARDGERRQVAVLFADLVGYTRLSSELDPEDVHAVLSAFFGVADRLVAEHGGMVDKHIGDCVMAVFGAPIAHGNDAERAARAALAIRDAAAALTDQLGRSIAVHIGIASGEVVASEVGSAGRRAYTVTGDSVNLASRLTSAARSGEILVSAAVHDALHHMECAAVGELSVKGLLAPIHAWRLIGPRRMAAANAPRFFVGREHERRQFAAALSACIETGRGHTIYIRGEAGIGKTRLIEEFRHYATSVGFSCHNALVLDFGTGAGRDAIGALVRSLLGVLPGESENAVRERVCSVSEGRVVGSERAVFLHDLLAFSLPPKLRPLAEVMDASTRARGAREALCDLIQRACAAHPILLAVEDLHWADNATLDTLAALANATNSSRALLVATARPEGDPLGRGWRVSGPLLTMDLPPLRSEEAQALASTLLDGTRSEYVARCVKRADGNPLFLEQLIRVSVDRTDNEAVPETIQSLVQARIDRLDPVLKQALQVASIFGQRFSIDGVRHLLGYGSWQPGPLIERYLVRQDGDELHFGHALIRDAVYATLLRSRRRELHRAAASWFVEQGDYTLCAEHLDRAEDPGAAAAYLKAAAAQADRYRYEVALAHVERGLALAHDPAERFALACRRGDLLHDLGRMADARTAYESAAPIAQNDSERCRIWLGLAAVKRIMDDLPGALEDLGRAEAVASQLGLKTEAARVHFQRGNLLFPRGDFGACLREHQKSLDLAHEAGSAELEAAALGGLADAEYASGRMMRAYERFRDCVALSRQHGFSRIEVANRPMMAFTRWFAVDTHGALSDADEAIAAARRVAHHRAEMIGHHAAWFCRHSLMDFEGAWAHADAALALSRRLAARRFDAEALAFQAELHRRAGRKEPAVAAAQEALRISRDTSLSFLGPFVLGILALVTDDQAARENALAEAEAILEAGSVSHNHLLFRRDAIEACLETGAWDRVDHHAAALEKSTRQEPLSWSTFFVSRARALAAFGRGLRDRSLVEELLRLQGVSKQLGFPVALPAIETALEAFQSN